MTKTALELLKFVGENGSIHYTQVSVALDYQMALTWLVSNEYLYAFGSKEWAKAQFSVTSKGLEELAKIKNGNP